MWDHMILEPNQDHVLRFKLSLLILLERININRNNNHLQGIILDAIFIINFQDLGLPDDEVGCSIQPVMIPSPLISISAQMNVELVLFSLFRCCPSKTRIWISLALKSLRNKLPLNFDFLHGNPSANYCRTTPL